MADLPASLRDGTPLAEVAEAVRNATPAGFAAARHIVIDAIEEIRRAVLVRGRTYLRHTQAVSGPSPGSSGTWPATATGHLGRLARTLPARADAALKALLRGPTEIANALAAVEACSALAEAAIVVERVAWASHDPSLRTVALSLRNGSKEPLSSLESLRWGMGWVYADATRLIPEPRDLLARARSAALRPLVPPDAGALVPEAMNDVVSALRAGYEGDVAASVFDGGRWPLSGAAALKNDVAAILMAYDDTFHAPGFVGMLRQAAAAGDVLDHLMPREHGTGIRIGPLMRIVDGPAPGEPRKLAFEPVEGRDDVLVGRLEGRGPAFFLYPRDERTFGQSTCLVVAPDHLRGDAVPEARDLAQDARDTFRGATKGANFASVEDLEDALASPAFVAKLVPGLVLSGVDMPDLTPPSPRAR